MPAALLTPPPPDALRYLLGWFDELSAGRADNAAGGPRRLSWADLHHWALATCRRLQPWELQALRRLDHAWCQTWIDGREKTRPKKER